MALKMDQSYLGGSTSLVNNRDQANYSTLNPNNNVNTLDIQNSNFKSIDSKNPYDSKPAPFIGYQEAPKTV